MKRIATHKNIFYVVTFCLALMALAFEAQGSGQYSEAEYQGYLKAVETVNPEQKITVMFEFLDKYPQSALGANILYEFQKSFELLFKNKENEKVITIARRLLDHYPQAKETAEVNLARACFNLKDYAEYLHFAEPIYARQPNVQMAYWMAVAAMRVKDAAQCDRYAAVVEKGGEFKQKVDLAFTLFMGWAKNEQEQKSGEYGRIVVSLLDIPEKPEEFSGDWDNYQTQVLCPVCGGLGMAEFKAGNYPQAIELFSKILKLNPRDAASYFYTGAACQLGGKAKSAVENFALAAVLNAGPISDKASEMIRKIIADVGADENKYDEYIANARKELGLN